MDTSTVLETEAKKSSTVLEKTHMQTEAKKLKNYPFHSVAADWLEAQKDREVIFLG